MVLEQSHIGGEAKRVDWSHLDLPLPQRPRHEGHSESEGNARGRGGVEQACVAEKEEGQPKGKDHPHRVAVPRTPKEAWVQRGVAKP